MRMLIAVILISFLTAVAGAEEPFTIGTSPNGILYAADRLVITVKTGTDPLLIDQTIAGTAYTGNDQIDLLCEQNSVVRVEPYYPYPVKNAIIREVVERMYVFKLAPDINPLNVKDNFATNKDIEFSDLWSVSRISYIPNDPSIAQQWALNKIDTYTAWDYVRGDTTANVIIAIDDSGVYYNHPDLQPNVWINGPEDINSNGIFDNYPSSQGGDINNYDDDGNGYQDDVVSWDFGFHDNDPQEDTPTHGTHVAGCASMATDNNTGGAGPGFSAKLMTTKATNTPGYITHGYQAMIYAGDNGAHIINCSWGNYYYSGGEQNVVTAVTNAGALVVAAAGNENTSSRGYPASYTGVLSVAATDQNDHKVSFSNYGSSVDVSAPGVSIYSTWAQSGYTYLDGTSMSSPVAAGVAALIKAQNLSYTPAQITTIIKSTTDNIDAVNPGYEGQMGTGRVNAYSAVAANYFPNIQLYDHTIIHISDDGDGIINPGESIDIIVVLENIWQDAENVSVKLRAPEGITVTDSAFFFGSIPGGGEQRDNNIDPFSLTYSEDLPPGEYELTLHVTADGDYSNDLSLMVTVSLFLSDFPVSLPDAIESDPLVCDIDGDDDIEILVGCNDSKLYSIELNGTNTPGWPVTGSDDFSTAPAAGDLDDDSDLEVVATVRNGDIYAWDHSGNLLSGFPYSAGGTVFCGPTLADLDNDGNLEIIQPCFQTKNLEIINHDGSVFGDWPYNSNTSWYGAAAVGDIDNDDEFEVVFAGFDSLLHVFNSDKTEVSGFPVALDNRSWISPAIGNIDPSDPEPEIVIATQSGSVYLINHDGTLVSGWPINIGTAVKSSPALGDLDNDDAPEIVFGGSDSDLYAYDSDGSLLSGFPVSLIANITASPVIADITGNGTADIIIGNGASETYLFGFNAQGQILPNFPISTSATGPVKASPAIWDLDNDYDLDIVVCVQNSNYNLDVIDYKRNSSIDRIHWAMYGNDKYRTSNFEAFSPIGIDDETISVPQQFGLLQNYPNPFNNHTIIRYSLDIPTEFSLEVYNILGQQVRNLDSGFKQAGVYDVIWNGRNDNGNDVTSGVYFYKLTGDDRTEVKRMLYLR